MKSSKRIMIVDDNRESRDFLSAIVENNGFQYDVFKDGKEALTAMQTARPDVLLLDIMMPKKSGVSVLAEMKKNTDLQSVPVIIITGTSQVTGVNIKTGEENPIGSDEDVVGNVFGTKIHKKLGELTPDEIVEKPVDPSVLIEKINELLS